MAGLPIRTRLGSILGGSLRVEVYHSFFSKGYSVFLIDMVRSFCGNCANN